MKIWVDWGEQYPVFYVSTEPDSLSHEVDVADDLVERHKAAGRAWWAIQQELAQALEAKGVDLPE